MKNCKGVTVIELVIVCICMILIIGFAMFSGISSVKDAEATALYVEMKNLMSAVSVVQTDINMGIVAELDQQQGVYYDGEYGSDEGYYLINKGTDITSRVIKNLNLKDLKNSYVVNFMTGEVRLLTPILIDKVIVETFEDVQLLVDLGE